MNTTLDHERIEDAAPSNHNQEPGPSELLSVQAAGNLTGRNTNTLYFWIKGGSLKKYTSPTGETLVSEAEVLALHGSKRPRPRKSQGNLADVPVTPPDETASKERTPTISEGTLPENVIAQSAGAAVAEGPTAIATETSLEKVTNDTASAILATGKVDIDASEKKVEIRSICFDPETQMRVAVDQKVIREYAEKMKNGERFPPVILFEDEQGKLFIGDGWHRLLAAKRNNYQHFPAEVRAGGRSAAMRCALRANVTHGLRLTSKDKRKKVTTALREYPAVSNNEIAEICGVSESLVRVIRDRFVKNEPALRIGADGKQYPARKAQPLKRISKQNVIFKRTTDLLQKLTLDRLQRLKEIIEKQLTRIGNADPIPAGAQDRPR